jgi:hypothetical protein
MGLYINFPTRHHGVVLTLLLLHDGVIVTKNGCEDGTHVPRHQTLSVGISGCYIGKNMIRYPRRGVMTDEAPTAPHNRRLSQCYAEFTSQHATFVSFRSLSMVSRGGDVRAVGYGRWARHSEGNCSRNCIVTGKYESVHCRANHIFCRKN